MKKITVRDIDVTHKRVLVRVDLNVPLDDTGIITDDSRIRAILPTVRYLIEQKAKIILCSHLGRPDGKKVEKLRLATVANRLSQILGQSVAIATDCIGQAVKQAVVRLVDGEVLILENLRFHTDEEKNGDPFARALSQLADIYVNDAFAVSHRVHASIVGVARYLPSVAGFLLESEVDTLSRILEIPRRPFVAILGGAKISDKIDMMENIINKADYVLIGGGIAATFLKASHHEVGSSLVDLDKLEAVTGFMSKANTIGTTIRLPQDVMVNLDSGRMSESRTASVGNIPQHSKMVDIGPMTVIDFYRVLRKCKTIFWNGTMGLHEIPEFAGGTKIIAGFLANLSAVTVVGGGSTAEAINKMGLADKMSFVSTGGGATLAFLGGQALPGVNVLSDKPPTVVHISDRVYA